MKSLFNLKRGPIKGRRRKSGQRKAVATVEFAICLPVLIVLTLGTMDLCSLIFLKESVTIAAYEGARRGVGRGRTNADVTSRVIEFLDDRDIEFDGAGLTQFSSPDFTSAETLENVTVTVTVPAAGNMIIPLGMFDALTVSSSVTMRKEYKNLTTN
ncbi:TadE family protein [Planctomycetes bacterium K23_9]|uniref:TadE-like protein n=1 Tax=Stieleria marina TaxID=1930275 RepID=A0A517NRV7_9BACT|nr:TadE-like protein [Planctomycetes bacterium K23_9]